MNRLAYLLAGAVLGAAGVMVAREVKNGGADGALKSVVQGGHNVVEKVLGAAETIKEDVEDYLAEAKYMHEQKMEEKQAEQVADIKETVEEVVEEVIEEVVDKGKAKKKA